MNSQILVLSLLTFFFVSSAYYPAEYDLRFEPDYRSCNFKVSEEGLCSANWGVILSEVLANMYCLKQKIINLTLSKQNLIDCVPKQSDTILEKCQFFGSSETFFKALNYLQTNGITTEDCYPYVSMLSGDDYDCSATCSNGTQITKRYQSNYVNLTSIDQVKDFLLYQGPAIAFLEAYDDLLHYQMKDSSEFNDGDAESSNYDSDLGYRALKIVGWMTDNGTEYWVAGNSWGQNWAVAGYMYLETTNPYILSYHGLQLQ